MSCCLQFMSKRMQVKKVQKAFFLFVVIVQTYQTAWKTMDYLVNIDPNQPVQLIQTNNKCWNTLRATSDYMITSLSLWLYSITLVPSSLMVDVDFVTCSLGTCHGNNTFFTLDQGPPTSLQSLLTDSRSLVSITLLYCIALLASPMSNQWTKELQELEDLRQHITPLLPCFDMTQALHHDFFNSVLDISQWH